MLCEVVDVSIGDVECADPAWFGRTVLNDVSHTRCAGEDVVADGPGLACGRTEDHRGLGGFGHPQPDPHRKQLPDRQDLFRGVLHGGDDRNSDGATLGEQQTEQLFDFGADLRSPM